MLNYGLRSQNDVVLLHHVYIDDRIETLIYLDI